MQTSTSRSWSVRRLVGLSRLLVALLLMPGPVIAQAIGGIQGLALPKIEERREEKPQTFCERQRGRVYLSRDNGERSSCVGFCSAQVVDVAGSTARWEITGAPCQPKRVRRVAAPAASTVRPPGAPEDVEYPVPPEDVCSGKRWQSREDAPHQCRVDSRCGTFIFHSLLIWSCVRADWDARAPYEPVAIGKALRR